MSIVDNPTPAAAARIDEVHLPSVRDMAASAYTREGGTPLSGASRSSTDHPMLKGFALTGDQNNGDMRLCQTGTPYGTRGLGTTDASRVVGSEYHYGSGGRTPHEITANEWNQRSAIEAQRDVARAAADITRHTGDSSALLDDAAHLRTALEHAREYLSPAQLRELVSSLPGLTGNKVTVSERNGHQSATLTIPSWTIYRPWDSLSNANVFDSNSTTRRQYTPPNDVPAQPQPQRTST